MSASNPFDPASAISVGPQERAAVASAAKWWWLLLLSAALWVVIGISLLQMNTSSLATVGYLVGFMLIFTGIEQFFVAGAVEGWKWVWVVFGVFFLVGGVWAVFNPIGTSAALASSLGLLFVLIAIFWFVEAISTRANNPFWLLTLISALVMLGMGIWVGSQGLLARAITLLVFAGIWAIMHGVGDAIRAFQLRRLGRLVA